MHREKRSSATKVRDENPGDIFFAQFGSFLRERVTGSLASSSTDRPRHAGHFGDAEPVAFRSMLWRDATRKTSQDRGKRLEDDFA